MEDVLEAVKNFFKGKVDVRFIQSCKRESKNGTFKPRMLVLTDHRIFFILKSPLCVEKYFYLIDIKGLECLSPDRLSIMSGSKNVVVVAESGFTQTVKEILSCLKRIHSSVPAQCLVQKLAMPSQRVLDGILGLVDKMNVEATPCGSFSAAYRCTCDYFSYPCLEDVIWDVEAIYYLHDSKEFNFRDFDYLDSKYHIPILAALQHNSYFTGLNFSNIKMVQQNVTELAKVLKSNCVLKYINLSNTSLKSNHVEKLCEAISSNQHSSISFLDVSKNNLDEKSVINFTSLSLNWVGLSLSETSLSQSALVSLFGLLSENSLNFKTLTQLDLSRNVLKKDATTALFGFLAHLNTLERLILESCEMSIENCFDHLLRGSVESLQELNLSGCHINRKKLNEGVLFRWKEFFSSAKSLKLLCLSQCHFSHEALKSVLLGLAVNTSISELDLRLSGNGFDSKLLDVFEVCLPLLSKKVTSLDLSNNSFVADDFKVLFDKLAQMKELKKLYIGRNLQNSKPKNLEVAVEALVNYLKQDELELECLHIDEMSLKSEAFLFLNHLGGDTHLVELNISANYIGPAGACLLSKALQINCMLKKVMMDKNEFNIQALHDIAHALSRNYFLKSVSMPFYDIMAIQRANPDRSEKLEEVIKKIESLISRNNNPSLLLQDKSFTSKVYMLQAPLLDDLVQASRSLQNAVNDTHESVTPHKISQIEKAKILLKETHSFIKTYAEYNANLRNENMPKSPNHDWERLTKLLKKLRSSGSNYQTESVHHLVHFLSKTCPWNFEIIKEKINFSDVRLQEIIMSPTLAKIIEDTEHTLNVAVPYAALELMKVVSELLASNLTELTNSLTNTQEEDEQSGTENFCQIRANSNYLKSRRSTLKEEIKGLTDALLESSFLKAPRMTRPTSSVIVSFSESPGFLYLPTLSDSLEHLNLQRPKPPKKHKATVPIPKIGRENNESDKTPKPLPRRVLSKEPKPRVKEPGELQE